MSSIFSTIFTPANLRFMMVGLGNTIMISIVTILLSLFFGTILALLRHFCHGKLKLLAWLSGIYIEFFRCTPNILWILWIRFTIKGDPIVLAVLACTLFTTAVMAEIIRGGLMSLDIGQSEAGRSLGLNYIDTMRFIVIPQAFKAILPSLGNEFIVLLKDTSMISVIGGQELIYFARNIVNRTFDAMFPLVGAAVIYLVLVMIFTWLQGKLERRLRQSDRR